jgi:cytochrome c-type biogenesis protein CcmH/NrfG
VAALAAALLVSASSPIYAQGTEPTAEIDGASDTAEGSDASPGPDEEPAEPADPMAALEAAARAAPDSAPAQLVLGRALLRRERAEEAAVALERARALDPALPGVDLLLGRAYRAADEPLEARAALQRAVERTPDDAEVWMVLGLTALDLNDVPTARHAFDTAGSLDPELTQLAEYNRAVAEIQEGDLRAAEATLEQTIELDPESVEARHARLLLERVRTRLDAIPEPKRWRLWGNMGLLYDDNVSTRAADVSSGVGDGAGLVELSGAYRLFDRGSTELEVGYDFYQTAYFDLSDFNLQIHGFSIDGTHPVGPGDLSLGYRYNLSTLGGDRFLDIHDARLGYGLSITPSIYSTLTPRFLAKNFEDDERDALQGAILWDTFIFFGEGGTYLWIGARPELEDADAPEFDYRGVSGIARLRAPFGTPLGEALLDLSYRFQLRDYENVTPSLGEKRDDRLHVARARLGHTIAKNVWLRLEYEYTRSDSNLPSVDYRQNIVALTATFSL